MTLNIRHLINLIFILCISFSGLTQNNIEEQIKLANSYLKTSNDYQVPIILHRILKHSKNTVTQIQVTTQLAQYYLSKNNTDSTYYYSDLALKNIDKTNDSLQYGRRSRIYNIKAVTSNHKGLIDEAASWHLKGISEAEKGNDDISLYINTHGLANIYRIQEKYDEALKLFKICLSKKNDPKFVYASLINIGIILSSQDDIETSYEYYKKALSLCINNDDIKCEIIININIASNLVEEKKYLEALVHYEKAVQLAKKHNFTRTKIIASFSIGETFIKAKNYKDAELILMTLLPEARQGNFLSIQKDIYDNLLSIYTIQRRHHEAFQMLLEKNIISDSIQKLQQYEEVEELEVKYRTLQKEKEIISLQKDQELKVSELSLQKSIKNIILISFLIILIPITILLILYYQKLQTQNLLNVKQKEINEQRITTLIKDQELKLIKAAINGQDTERKKIAQELHDSIGGNLAAIKLQFGNLNDSADNHKFSKIYKQLDDTYDLVRNLSHNLVPKKFRQHHFIPLLKEYINTIAKSSDIQTNILTYPEEKINTLDQELQYEIFMILQELITNAIKHAEASVLDIQFNLINETMNILFEDNGKGFNFETDKTGIGLSNIKNRLENLSGTLHIDSHPNRGTIINFELPIKPTSIS